MTDKLFEGVEFPEKMDLRLAAVFASVSEGRMRSLLREETIPSTKDEAGKYVVTKAEITKWLNTKGAKTTRGAAGPRGEGKAFIVKVPFAKLQAVKEALATQGIELQPRYDYSKQKAYQAKRKAEKAAAKAAKPAPVAAVAGEAVPVKK